MQLLKLGHGSIRQEGNTIIFESGWFNKRGEYAKTKSVYTGHAWSVDVTINFTHIGEIIAESNDFLRAHHEALNHFGFIIF